MARVLVLVAAVAAVAALAGGACAADSAADLARSLYGECLSRYSIACVKPRALEWLARAASRDEILITEDLSVVRTAADEESERAERADPTLATLERVERFLETHALRVRVPAEVVGGEAAGLVPRALLAELPGELVVPLDEEAVELDEEARSKKKKIIKKLRKRGFIRKVVVPFLLGLKFKAAVLVPLALALIALKTWKALTLGLISLVLSGAMVIFKFTKPKVVNYEVIHYPQHHVEHHVDHHDHAPAWDAHAHAAPYQARARSSPDAHQMAYAAQL